MSDTTFGESRGPRVVASSPLVDRAMDRVMAVQRPAVLAHLRSVRLRNPSADGAQLVRALERRYLALVTTAGAGIGVTAAIPSIGTASALALAGAETVGFLESTALFAQSVAEVHGIAVDDPERARALVMGLMLGSEAAGLLSQLGQQARGGPGRSRYWGELLASQVPRAVLAPISDQLKTKFVREFTGRAGASVVGKALPFGVGAAVGGTGNHLLGRKVVRSSRQAFGAAPLLLPSHLQPRPDAVPLERRAVSAARRLIPGRGKTQQAIDPPQGS